MKYDEWEVEAAARLKRCRKGHRRPNPARGNSTFTRRHDSRTGFNVSSERHSRVEKMFQIDDLVTICRNIGTCAPGQVGPRSGCQLVSRGATQSACRTQCDGNVFAQICFAPSHFVMRFLISRAKWGRAGPKNGRSRKRKTKAPILR
jgi:hypothetical protein